MDIDGRQLLLHDRERNQDREEKESEQEGRGMSGSLPSTESPPLSRMSKCEQRHTALKLIATTLPYHQISIQTSRHLSIRSQAGCTRQNTPDPVMDSRSTTGEEEEEREDRNLG
ncbi:hypothetical protein IFR05_015491 [Cadophora sp. M221]|nr:hypothetical protein IFR05_015491 [Cadophora sp. M221]